MRFSPTLLLSTLLAIALSIVGAPSQYVAADTSKTAVPRIDCAMATATPELNHCAEIRLKKADSELAAALERVRAQIGKRAGPPPYDKPTWTAAIVDADKTWKAYREADCKGLVPHEWQGGTGTALAVLECMAQMTEQRAFELTERYADRR